MKIKSFFLGSAAALVAVCNAKAADVVEAAVIVEPEPMEYVRVCDAYGAGFFYIPGTETCLKFSGYVRADAKAENEKIKVKTHFITSDRKSLASSRGGTESNTPVLDSDFVKENNKDNHSRTLGYRGRLNIDVRNETEWGTLRSQIRFQGGSSHSFKKDEEADGRMGDAGERASNTPDVEIARALISLAGFRAGYSADYWSTIGDYGYFIAANDGLYGNGSALLADYTFAFNGFAVTAGVQVASFTEKDSDEDGIKKLKGSGTAYKPDPYIGAKYSGSWGNVFGTYYHDSSTKKGAYKVGAELDMGQQFFDGSVKGWYMDDSGETNYVRGNAWGITAKVELAETFELYGGYSRYNFKHPKQGYKDSIFDEPVEKIVALGGDLGLKSRHADDWTLGARWNIVSGLNAVLEYNNRTEKMVLEDVGQTSKEVKTDLYMLRITRAF